jgi:hypothetical protein
MTRCFLQIITVATGTLVAVGLIFRAPFRVAQSYLPPHPVPEALPVDMLSAASR